jgi:hypothetical protein
MSYSNNETLNQIEPVELFVFNYAGQQYRFTSSDIAVTKDSLVYTAVPIKRTELEVSNDIARTTININIDKNNPIAQIFVQGSLTMPMFVDVYSAHVFDDGSMEFTVMYTGRVTTCDLSGVEAKLNCEPIFTGLKRMGLRRVYETTCSHKHYDTNTCWFGRADLNAFSQTVSGVSQHNSKTLYVPNPTGNAAIDRYYSGGIVEFGIFKFFIQDHSVISEISGRVAVIRFYRHVAPSVIIPASVTMRPGCDHKLSTCNSMFNNVKNFSGFPYVPDKNPFKDSNVPFGG